MQKREIQIMIKSTKTNQRRISLMDYCIRKLLGLTEENFITDEKSKGKKNKNRKSWSAVALVL